MNLVNLRSILVLSASLSILFASSLGWTQQEDQSAGKTTVKKSKVTKKAKKDKKDKPDNVALSNIAGGAQGFRFQTTATHVPKLRNDQEDVTEIFAFGEYSFGKKHRVRVQQFFTKFYGKYESEYEFQAADTQLVHFYRLPSWKGASLQWRTALAVPISNASIRDDLLTRLTGSLIAVKPILKGKVILVGVPYGRYHFYEYRTSVSGRLLPRYTYGFSGSAIYMATPKLSFTATGNVNSEYTYESQFASSGQTNKDQGLYRFDLDVTYQFSNSLFASLGFNQGASQYADGRYELVFYDNEVSRFTGGLTYMF